MPSDLPPEVEDAGDVLFQSHGNDREEIHNYSRALLAEVRRMVEDGDSRVLAETVRNDLNACHTMRDVIQAECERRYARREEVFPLEKPALTSEMIRERTVRRVMEGPPKEPEVEPCPCPWCGGKTAHTSQWTGGHVQCTRCGARGPQNDSKAAQWNTIAQLIWEPRPSPAPREG